MGDTAFCWVDGYDGPRSEFSGWSAARSPVGGFDIPAAMASLEARGQGHKAWRTLGLCSLFGRNVWWGETATPIRNLLRGRADEQRRLAKHRETMASETEAKSATELKNDEEIASGKHCLSSWDGSLPNLKRAVKEQLRNPGSFDHVNTVTSPVDEKGTFGLIMTYRAQNGFGGTNMEAVGVEVDAKTCFFKRASEAALRKRLRASS